MALPSLKAFEFLSKAPAGAAYDVAALMSWGSWWKSLFPRGSMVVRGLLTLEEMRFQQKPLPL
jgi:hypothetical protein